ncbi:hypothetical protein ACWC4E_10430 [Streptomyces sp. NPDC001273]
MRRRAARDRWRTAGATTGHSPEAHAIARSRGVSAARIRLAWTLHQGPHVLAIPGTGDLGHLVRNVAVGSPHLAGEELAVLDSLRHGTA